MALKRVPLQLVEEEVVVVEAGGWFELDPVLFGSFGGWMRARGLSCHCLVDSCPEIFIHMRISINVKSRYLPISVCFGLSGTFGGSDRGGWSRLEVGGLKKISWKPNLKKFSLFTLELVYLAEEGILSGCDHLSV